MNGFTQQGFQSGGSDAPEDGVSQTEVDAILNEAAEGGERYRVLLNLQDRLRKLQLDFDASFSRDLMNEAQEGLTLHLTIRVGPEEFAIPITQVRRLVRGAEVVPLPGAPRHLTGVINFRGDLVTVYDLPFMYGYPPTTGQAVTNVVVLKGEAFDAGLSVTDIGRLMSLDTTDLGASPGTLPAPLRQIVRGTSYQGNRLLLFPDIPRLFTQLDARR
jgi:purine-binding chemotaxis protein CheW